METLIGLALKSLLIAGVTLGLLFLARRRSASERSLVAHLGLVALVALPFASLALPQLHIDLPDALKPAPAAVVEAAPMPAAPTSLTAAPLSTPVSVTPTATASDEPAFDWTPYAYATPAVALLLLTLLALLRLVTLRSRAEVLVDPTWLSALAHAQRRMGIKNGTALLTSDELHSPISWGWMRPVILLNREALSATGEAEAIIAHELAHVARLDWAKLMLARVATAVFWFNPLAWVLAREAHQLREEAADDAVLAANIESTDYAQLLVGVARHECKGLLLGAHGVAPGKGSLRRRVSRVLDGTLARGPGSRSWVAGFAAGMLVMAAPLAAVTFRPAEADTLSAKDVRTAEAASTVHAAAAIPAAPAAAEAPIAPVAPIAPTAPIAPISPMVHVGPDGILVRGPDGPIVNISAIHPGGGRRSIETRALNITPEYERSIRMAAPPSLGQLDHDELIELKAVGVTPEFVRDIAAAGFPHLTVDDVVEARALGVSGAYIREMRAAGVKGDLDNYGELHVVGVTPEFVRKAKAAGVNPNDTDRLTEMRVLGGHDPRPRTTRDDD